MVVPKFRAWDTFDEDMVNDIFFSWQDCGYESLNECLSDERWKFMQSTGLVDKNGKEIFEGDVVESTWFKGYDDCVGYRKAGVVVYRDGCFRIEYPGEEEKGYFSITLKFAVSVEIIGNIYENPELVEGQS
ncbi:TPA: hypothetical protein U1Z55_001016 [Streptococcus suis]|nr:hypothetical protein [Streptococcus suis]